MPDPKQLEQVLLVIDPKGELGAQARALLPCLRTVEVSNKRDGLKALAEQDRTVIAAILAVHAGAKGPMTVGRANVSNVFDALHAAGIPQGHIDGYGTLPPKEAGRLKQLEPRARRAGYAFRPEGLSRKALLDLLRRSEVRGNDLVQTGVPRSDLAEMGWITWE